MSSCAGSQRGLGWAALGLLVMLAVKASGLDLPLPGCPLRALTGLPCPTCFLTRSMLAALRGDLAGALELHLFGPPLLLALAWLGWHQGVRGRPLPGVLVQGKGLLFAGLMLFGYWLIRLVHWSVLGELPA
ncbi:MAG: DUF2752 domain-containing protein [Prochlorococcus sp.]|nr:DUF2752 domain-containing protein [Prochlorococcaceae cyanobacterium Fu_MAG_50]